MTKYKAQIRADLLQVYGVDLGVWLAEGRFHALWELVNQLPPASRFQSAILNDPEVAEMVVSVEEELGEDQSPREPWAPPLEDYSTQTKLLTDLIDSVNSLLPPLVKIAGGKPPKFRQSARPVTEIDRARERRAEETAINIGIQFGFDREDFM